MTISQNTELDANEEVPITPTDLILTDDLTGNERNQTDDMNHGDRDKLHHLNSLLSDIISHDCKKERLIKHPFVIGLVENIVRRNTDSSPHLPVVRNTFIRYINNYRHYFGY